MNQTAVTELSHLPVFLTVEEVATLLRKGRTSTYQAITRGEIPSVRLGGTIRVPRDAIGRLIADTGEPTLIERIEALEAWRRENKYMIPVNDQKAAHQELVDLRDQGY